MILSTIVSIVIVYNKPMIIEGHLVRQYLDCNKILGPLVITLWVTLFDHKVDN